MKDSSDKVGSSKAERKTYVAPRLAEYGHIEKMTRGMGNTTNEMGGKKVGM